MSIGSAIGLTAAIASVAAAAPARAVELEQLVGRWSIPEYDECSYPDNSEGAPLAIRRDGDEIWIGNYGWLCSVPVKDWKKDGGFLVGSAKGCGMEGGDDTFDETFVLGLNGKDELLMSADATDGLRRCPAVAE
ncbi:MAG: hypothetical protein KDK89_19200 [Alphaproteobacteria bacterium]|nr:hypothetical protein [Alphaproteobacteria bacterium]